MQGQQFWKQHVCVLMESFSTSKGSVMWEQQRVQMSKDDYYMHLQAQLAIPVHCLACHHYIICSPRTQSNSTISSHYQQIQLNGRCVNLLYMHVADISPLACTLIGHNEVCLLVKSSSQFITKSGITNNDWQCLSGSSRWCAFHNASSIQH